MGDLEAVVVQNQDSRSVASGRVVVLLPRCNGAAVEVAVVVRDLTCGQRQPVYLPYWVVLDSVRMGRGDPSSY